jgi:hypothetical protein
MPIGISLRVARLLRHGGHCIRPDVREEENGRCAGNPFQSVRGEGDPVFGPDVPRAENEEEKNDDQARIKARGFTDANDHYPGHQHDDAKGRQVENDPETEQPGDRLPGERAVQQARIELGRIGVRRLLAGHLGGGLQRGAEIRPQPGRKMEMEPVQQHLKVPRPGDGDGGGTDGLFEDQVPADQPGGQLAQRGVGIRVNRPKISTIAANSE